MPIDSGYYQKKLKNEKELEHRKAEFEAAVMDSEVIRNLIPMYDESSIKNLVDQIVNKKIDLLKEAEFLNSEWDDFHLQYVEYAHKLLELILSKKLFNMECQWRAEEIRIPEIKTTHDFDYWASDISNCPFLEPIEEKEIEVLKMFMRTSNFEIKNWSWERGLDYDFDRFMQKDEDGDRHLPEFFEYYDGLMGTFYLLNKQDYRTEKEVVYTQLYFEKEERKAKKKQAKIEAGLKEAPPPYFSSHGAEGDAILRQTEPEDFWELEEALADNDLHKHFHEQGYKEIFDYFMRCSDDIRLPAWLKWDEGMEHAYNQHRNAKALDVLELALEEHNLKAEMGLFDTSKVEKQMKKCWWRKFILKGRKIAGENEDFEF